MKIAPNSITLKNSKTLTLRSAQPSDAQNILNHLKISHSESYRNMNQPAEFWINFPISEEEKLLAEIESSKHRFMLIAEFEGRIVGGLSLLGQFGEFASKNASIGMSIQNEFSQVGLGTQMIQYMKTQAKEAGFHRIVLSVRTYNSAGIALYEKCGFQRIGLMKEAAFLDNEFVDEYSYQIIL